MFRPARTAVARPRRVRPAARRLVFGAALASLVAASACVPRFAGGPTLVVASKSFSEGAILGYIDLLLLRQAGYRVVDRIEMGPTLIMRQALLGGQIDTYVEYTGTALVNFFHLADRTLLADAQASWRRAADEDRKAHGIVWLKPMALDNTYTVLVPREKARAWGVRTISDLAAYAARHPVRFGVDPEFVARADGLPQLEAAYGLHPSDTRQLDAGLVYATLHQGALDAAIGYSTDGRIPGFGLVRLLDDRHQFPSYHPAPLFRQAVVAAHPDVATVLDPVAPLLTDDEVTALNYRMDVQQANAEDVARDWLTSKGLLKHPGG